ncbi:hypothetical protein L3Q82_010510, partial [Scortum barcoo]
VDPDLDTCPPPYAPQPEPQIPDAAPQADPPPTRPPRSPKPETRRPKASVELPEPPRRAPAVAGSAHQTHQMQRAQDWTDYRGKGAPVQHCHSYNTRSVRAPEPKQEPETETETEEKQLHCTAYVSQGPDPECDNEFSAEVKDSLHCSALFWSVSRERYLSDAELCSAASVPGPDDGEPHNCLAELQVVCSPRPDLSDTPLTNPDLILYVDGSATRDPLTGVNRVGFAVVSDNATLVSGPLPHHLSAQAAEPVVALTEACKFAADLSPNEISMKKALALLQSMESTLEQDSMEATTVTADADSDNSVTRRNVTGGGCRRRQRQQCDGQRDERVAARPTPCGDSDNNSVTGNSVTADADSDNSVTDTAQCGDNSVTGNDNSVAGDADSDNSVTGNVTADADGDSSVTGNVAAVRRRRQRQQCDGQRRDGPAPDADSDSSVTAAT